VLHLVLLLAIQSPQASLAGTVSDEATGVPIAGALVSLPDLDRDTVTDVRGRYVLTDVPAGPQHVLVRYIGYAQHALHALVPPGGTLQIDIALQAEPVRLGTIEVRSPPSIRGLEARDSSEPADRSVSMAAIRNHPALAEPDAFQGLEGGPVVIQPESPSGVHIRGGASDQTGYVLDGIPVLSPYHAAGTFSAWNPDAVAGLRLFASMPSLESPAALSGTVAGETRTPGARLAAQGSLSTSQARFTADGPLGRTGAGFLVSMRSTFPGSPAPQNDASYLRLESGDMLLKLEAPLLGGRARLLGFSNENEVDASAAAVDDASRPPRNGFEWNAGSVGLDWRRTAGEWSLGLTGWGAETDAASRWDGAGGGMRLSGARHDLGLVAAAERRAGREWTKAGVRVERSRTTYEVDGDALAATTPVATLFGRHTRPLGAHTDLTLGASVAAADGGVHVAPGAQLRWRLSPALGLSAALNRTHQFAQSLRNSESVVGNVFPADLFIGSGAPGVPTARSDLAVLAADYRPGRGVRLGLEGYLRRSDGLLLVAPRSGEPFSPGSFAVGSGSAAGLSLEAALSRTRYALLASYGLERARLGYSDSTYVPEYGTTHLLEGGAILFPTATLAVKIGATAGFGRRATAAVGGFEWESCNLLDRGCEFSGSPIHDGEALGGTALPGYLRFDLGVRKHWHLHLGGRDAVVALFGTVTNLLNRGNVLTFIRDPSTGERAPVEMRPLAPLLVGLDWQL
jgi:hypothetical protein